MYHQEKTRNVVTHGLLLILCALAISSSASASYHLIGDLVWYDANRNGIQDPGEEGVGGVIVNVRECGADNAIIRSTTTATPENPRTMWGCVKGVGSYSIWLPGPVHFYLEFILPEDSIYTFTAVDQGGDDTLDSDVDPATGWTTECFTWPDHESGDNEMICTFDAGLVLPEDDEPCFECKGKVTELTLWYNGASGATVKVVQKRSKKDGGDTAVFEQYVAAGEMFTVLGADKNGTLGTEISLYVDGVLNTKIHTSCSQPIGPGLISGDFEVVEGYSKAGGLLCPADDCDCEGKVTQLTLGYIGISEDPITVTQKKGKKQLVVFSEDGVNDVVTEDGIFTINGRDKNGTLGTEISIYIGSKLNARIHTSCSKPIGPGLIRGDFLVLEGYSLRGGPLCPVKTLQDCACEGKVTELTLQYNGEFQQLITVIQKDGKHGLAVFEGLVDAGGQFTFTGLDKHGTLGMEISIYVGEQMELQTKIHTSCSRPIGPGLISGDFEVIDGYSREGGPLCPLGD